MRKIEKLDKKIEDGFEGMRELRCRLEKIEEIVKDMVICEKCGAIVSRETAKRLPSKVGVEKSYYPDWMYPRQNMAVKEKEYIYHPYICKRCQGMKKKPVKKGKK